LHACRSTLEDPPALGTLEGQGIPVYSFTASETVGTSGMLREAGSVTESLQLPQTLDYRDASLSIQVEPSLAASLQSGGTELEFVIMVIAVSCVKLLSAHNSTQHTSRKHKV
jgi:hypothetical protein